MSDLLGEPYEVVVEFIRRHLDDRFRPTNCWRINDETKYYMRDSDRVRLRNPKIGDILLVQDFNWTFHTIRGVKHYIVDMREP